MNTELYQQLFNKLDSLSAIRKDLTFGCKIGEDYTYIGSDNYDYLDNWGQLTQDISDEDKIIGHPPVLSDVFTAFDEINYNDGFDDGLKNEIWSLWNNKLFLSDQSDELGEYLLTLLR